jgi:hypothetical protein
MVLEHLQAIMARPLKLGKGNQKGLKKRGEDANKNPTEPNANELPEGAGEKPAQFCWSSFLFYLCPAGSGCELV